ncbi:Hypothetical predicted protein [Lecanosticta acicola]|uniref:Uncharacterized protein n=1 Tax=Lecanosticta acicola TaxID=111012 RepID=A0AAI8YWS9_9PEZI|nr:Hypothetical predicted protein [Lecanosticta acicola]
MRGTDKRDVHLLAHISAPSSRGDDDRYRAQIESYLRCSGTRRRRAAPRPVASTEVQRSQGGPDVYEQEEEVTDPHASGSFIEDTQLAWTALESQLPTSSLAPIRSATKRALSVNNSTAGARGSKATWSSQDGYRRIELTPSRQRQRENPREFRQSSGNRESGVALSSSAREDRNQHHVNSLDRRTPDEIIGSNETTSELPTSYSLSEGTSGSSKEREQLSLRSASDPGPQLGALVADIVDASKLRGQDRSPDKNTGCEVRSNIARRRQPAPLTETDAQPAQPAIDDATLCLLQSLSTTIHPPSPEVSLRAFSSHVTPAMEHLAQESAVSDCFKPVAIFREPELLERGHWSIDCSPWPLEEQVNFWRTLQDVGGSGRAGWGVWCSRGAPIQCEDKTSPERYGEAGGTTKSATETASVGPIRVYCWGEVVKHVYLMLYVASKSRVRRLGLQWIDSEGTVIVQMPRPK